MQTFMPYVSFGRSASVLDRQRLGKQRIETKQILTTLLTGGGWKNHPAVRMWAGHELALCQYGMDICAEWRNRGYVDHQYDWFREKYTELFEAGYNTDNPEWLGDERLHGSHRSALMSKNPDWYAQFNWTDPVCIAYWWPTKERENAA